MPSPIQLDGSGLTMPEISDVAARQRTVEVSRRGLQQALASAEFADAEARRRPLYGRSTGVGANRGLVVPDSEPGSGPGSSSGAGSAAHAMRLLRSHATAAGPARSAERVRAMLVIRLNQLAAGGSGVRPEVLIGLTRLLAADALPAVLAEGSLGTADLSALAAVGLALAGERATAPGTAPAITLTAADGLGLMSSNAATLADAALACTDLDVASRAAVAVAALTACAVDGNPEAFAETVDRATPFPGAREVARLLRTLVPGPGVRVQDPFPLRTLPQVHGPVLEAVGEARSVIEALCNAPAENPLVLPASPGAVHHGGFHLAYLQMALDRLNLAVAQSGAAMLGRLGLLIDPSFTGLRPFLGDDAPAASGVMVCEYVAGSALAALRAAAQPAGLQTVVLSRGVESDASFASLAAAQAATVATEYRVLLSTELVAAVRALRQRESVLSGPAGRLLAVCTDLPAPGPDRDLSPDLALAQTLLSALAAVVDDLV